MLTVLHQNILGRTDRMLLLSREPPTVICAALSNAYLQLECHPSPTTPVGEAFVGMCEADMTADAEAG